MQQPIRKAGEQLWNFYKNNAAAQDLIETGAWAATAATGQAIFTDMEAGDIAASTALGAGAALAARPVGRRLGASIGGLLDGDPDFKLLGEFQRNLPFSKEGRDNIERRLGKNNPIMELIDAKYNQNAFNPDGSQRGEHAAMLSYYLGNRLDNVAQALVALGTPMLTGNEED